MGSQAKPKMDIRGGHRDMPGVTPGQGSSIPSAFAMAHPHYSSDTTGSHWLISASLVKTNLSFSPGTSTTSAWMELLAIWERQELRSSIPASENYISSLIWNLHPEQAPSPSKAAHTTGAGGSVFFPLMATVNTLVVHNSNTQQQHTGYKPQGSLCLPKVLQIKIYILRFIATSICIQVTHKQQQSELHLHPDTSVFSILCGDQDLQVPKLFHPGHPNLLCYNAWEERTFQLFSHHYMKA